MYIYLTWNSGVGPAFWITVIVEVHSVCVDRQERQQGVDGGGGGVIFGMIKVLSEVFDKKNTE